MKPSSILIVALLIAGCAQSSEDAQYGSASEVVAEHGGELVAAANDDDLNARYMLVLSEYWEQGKYSEAVPHLEELAGDGSSGAAHHLANAYSQGQGVEQNIETAAYWLGVAADLGSEDARHSLEAYNQNQGPQH